MYFGEYPLSFAVCINQVDCYRLLISKKADPNAKDTNGNTVLHLAVIHEKPVIWNFKIFKKFINWKAWINKFLSFSRKCLDWHTIQEENYIL